MTPLPQPLPRRFQRGSEPGIFRAVTANTANTSKYKQLHIINMAKAMRITQFYVY